MSLSFADAIFWIAAALCLIAEVAIVRATLFGRLDPTASGVPVTRRPLEVVWAVVPAIALALVLAHTWRVMHRDEDAQPPARADVVTVSSTPPSSRR